MRQRNRHGRARPPEPYVFAYETPEGERLVRVSTHRQVDRMLEALRGQGCTVLGMWMPEHARQGLRRHGLDFLGKVLDLDLLSLS